MMFIIKIVFWIAIFGLLYIYFGYPIMLGAIALFRHVRTKADKTHEPI
jgi:hypothetical protein